MMVVNVSGRSFRIFHPAEVGVQKKENDIGTKGSFVGLDIEIKDNRFSVSLYNKRDNFLISTVKMPFLHSNILFEIFCPKFGAEISRIAGTTIMNLILLLLLYATGLRTRVATLWFFLKRLSGVSKVQLHIYFIHKFSF